MIGLPMDVEGTENQTTMRLASWLVRHLPRDNIKCVQQSMYAKLRRYRAVLLHKQGTTQGTTR